MTSSQLLQSRSGDAAYHITEECERLFCETLRTAFLVEKNAGAARNSLVMGTLEHKGYTDESVVDVLYDEIDVIKEGCMLFALMRGDT